MEIVWSVRLDISDFDVKPIFITPVMLRNGKEYQELKTVELTDGGSITLEGILRQEISEDLVQTILDAYRK